jgi:hypothetical protein
MILIEILALLLASTVGSAPPNAAATASLRTIARRTGPVADLSVPLVGLDPNSQYSVLYSLTSLNGLGPDARVDVEVRQGSEVLASKTLHAGDADYYTQFRVLKAGRATVVVHPTHASGNYALHVNRWPRTELVKSVPARRWQDAVTIPLGQTVFASGDDESYVPVPGTPRRTAGTRTADTDWYAFEFTSATPKLVFFLVDLMERDQIPVDVSVYRLVNGEPKEYFDGEDPVTLPHEAQALTGNKFTPRILKDRGTYYVAVQAGHPEYKLRTRIYDPPPYADPKTAVRTALDYILAAGDSWHANTPRRGSVYDRVSSVHQETSLCVACHVTHFPLRAALYAARNGYPVVQRQQLQFMTERFYNNPRPFYGFEQDGAVWARVISAPANVLGRMSHLIDLYERQISGERRPTFHDGIREYLKLYYAGRDTLPPDETNGNTPLVSRHEVAWYAWSNTHDARMGDLIARGEIENMVDLCYQTLALAEIDPQRYRDQIQKNAERILSLQRPDGQWSMRFAPEQPEVEFQTGHALWALQAAGVPASNPQVAKAIDYLLRRQQPFGGWMDPLQSFENFRTPFRETQMAVLALSSYFPDGQPVKGWGAAAPARLSSDPVEVLHELDGIWDPVTDGMRAQIRRAAVSPDALIRQAAAEALGRLGGQDAVLFELLGDPSKMVQRTAAWAVRQSYSRHPETSSAGLSAVLESRDDRTRWGATRVFAQHFAAIAKRPEFGAILAKRVSDPVTSVRMQAVKGLWQFWFWTTDTATKELIENTLLAAMGQPQPSWVESNLEAAVYNLADENIRYLYNNWVALLPSAADRDRAVRGRLAVESRLATKFAEILEQAPAPQKKKLLRALTEFPLRRGDIYDPEADIGSPAPPVYNRIGNDIEQIAFFGESGARIARALSPLLDEPDPEMRRLAAQAALLVREVRFGDVNRIAGPSSPEANGLAAKMERIPEAADALSILKPPPPPAGAATGPAARATRKLDEAFFRGYVEPILTKRGRDGYACVHCHSTHTLFNATFATALNVVDQANPENSLILRKPTSSSETEGIAGSATLSHGGGVRFTKDSPEYATILEWIKGAKE